MLNEQQQLFRNAMSNLAAAVNVITSDGEAGKCGLTATAVCSVTDTPPTVLVCVNKNSEMNEVFKKNGKLCVNVCSAEQEEVACHFAGMTDLDMEQRFALDIWQEGVLDLPVLDGAIANLEGRIKDISEMGTHSVLFVELENIQTCDSQDALVYFARNFKAVEAA